jgi:hypothetical protein
MAVPTTDALPEVDIYLHVRVLMGMIVGLALTHLLRHAARIVEHPGQTRIYWVHLVWALSMFLFLLHFWWWEFRLASLQRWSFNLYLFVVIYALLLYLLCALIFPEQIAGYKDCRDYYYSRRAWFFGTLAVMCDRLCRHMGERACLFVQFRHGIRDMQWHIHRVEPHRYLETTTTFS